MNLKRMHSTSVVIDDNGVLILGDSGSGKSDLALRLIDNGATLISDDISICRKNSNNIYLYCPPEIKGLLEVREIGIITVPFVERIKLRLVVNLKSINNEGFQRIVLLEYWELRFLSSISKEKIHRQLQRLK